jgi:hypothetical protein
MNVGWYFILNEGTVVPVVRSQLPKIAYDRGYRVVDGEVYNKKGRVRRCYVDTRGYLAFTIVMGSRPKRQHRAVYVHRLVAYQKYKDQIFDLELEVRHLDSNLLNNMEDNVVLGTHRQNMMDVPVEERMAQSVHAASSKRKFTDDEMEEIRELYEEVGSYKKVMERFSITSKGTLHHILNHRYKTEKRTA